MIQQWRFSAPRPLFQQFTPKTSISLPKTLSVSSIPMLKVLASTCRSPSTISGHIRRHVPAAQPVRPLLSHLVARNRRSPYAFRRFFCSDSTDGADSVVTDAKAVESGDEAVAESEKSSSAIMPTVFRPEDFLTV